MNSNYIYKKTEKNFERKDELNRIVTLLNKNYQSFQEKYNINEISIIGSFARGEQTEESDLNIMVDFTKPIGWEVVDLRDELEKLPGMKIDLILKAGVMHRKQLFSQILEDAVYVKA